jgi:hypothetical protein
MSCGCGKKKKLIGAFGQAIKDSNTEYITSLSPNDWGPLLWKLLHIMGEHVGKSVTPSLNRDEAIMVDFIIQGLPGVIPCSECAQHARSYIRQYPSSQVKNLLGKALTEWTRNYFFNFHNNVLIRQQRSLVFTDSSEIIPIYDSMIFQKCDTEQLIEYFSFGVHSGLIKGDFYKRWIAQLNRLRLIAGF